jgi:LysM repeat protein
MNKLLLILLIFAILAGVAYGSANNNQRDSDLELVIHTVAPNETLWDIAKFYSPYADPRKVVYVIRQANHLKSAVIYPGQDLIVPVGLKK